MEEVFGTGTAVGIAMIQEIGYKDLTLPVLKSNPVSQMVMDTLNGIKTGKLEDEFNWLVKADLSTNLSEEL